MLHRKSVIGIVHKFFLLFSSKDNVRNIIQVNLIINNSIGSSTSCSSSDDSSYASSSEAKHGSSQDSTSADDFRCKLMPPLVSILNLFCNFTRLLSDSLHRRRERLPNAFGRAFQSGQKCVRTVDGRLGKSLRRRRRRRLVVGVAFVLVFSAAHNSFLCFFLHDEPAVSGKVLLDL